MEPNDMLRADPLDILFENRNKSYGAYPLRKYYEQRMYISLGTMISLVLLFIVLYLKFQENPITIPAFPKPDITLIDITPPPPVKPDQPPAHPSAPRPLATTEYTIPLIVSNQPDPKPLTTIEELSKTVIGMNTTPGEPDNGMPSGNGNANAGVPVKSADSTESVEKIFDRAEIMPEFPGGIEALQRFLLKNLRMPEDESEMPVRVVVRFVVAADGKVKDIDIVQPGGSGFDREVQRVMHKMPDWKPGMQNNRPVAVYFNLPVNFVGRED